MFFSIEGVVQIRHIPSVSSHQPVHCSGMDFLGDPMHRVAVAFCTLLSSFSITLTAQFTHSHLIFKPNDPDHVSFSAPWWREPSLLYETTERPGGCVRAMRLSPVWLFKLWSEWERTDAFPEGWGPVLTEPPRKWRLRAPTRLSRAKEWVLQRWTLQSLSDRFKATQKLFISYSLFIAPSASVPNTGS